MSVLQMAFAAIKSPVGIGLLTLFATTTLAGVCAVQRCLRRQNPKEVSDIFDMTPDQLSERDITFVDDRLKAIQEAQKKPTWREWIFGRAKDQTQGEAREKKER